MVERCVHGLETQKLAVLSNSSFSSPKALSSPWRGPILTIDPGRVSVALGRDLFVITVLGKVTIVPVVVTIAPGGILLITIAPGGILLVTIAPEESC